ncbi:MAG: hypothetical protein U9Q96_00520 [Patescibacteria group bacterium]|nr:hypothetical protein [Patescibacteria group bacterium]
MSQNLFAQYLVWHFFDVPKELGKVWKDYLRSYFNFFSTGSLLKTLFAPWHGMLWSYGRGFSFTRYAETIISNGFSRIIGAIIRVFLIVFGLVVETFVFFLGAIIFFAWLLLPLILVINFAIGIKLLF